MTTRRAEFETRFDGLATDGGTFTGYAAVWGAIDSFGDLWQRGAFGASLAEHRAAGTRPAMLWAHDPAEPIGVWETLEEDDRGLKVTGRLALGTRRGAEVHELLRMQAFNGLSVGFRARDFTRRQEGRGRVLRAVELIEISPVVRPSVRAARITDVRSAVTGPAGLAAFIRGHAAKLQGNQR